MNVKNNIKLFRALVTLFFTVNGQLFAYSLNILGISPAHNIRPILQLIYVQDFEKLLSDTFRYQNLMNFKSILESIDDEQIYDSDTVVIDSSNHQPKWLSWLRQFIKFPNLIGLRHQRLFAKYYRRPELNLGIITEKPLEIDQINRGEQAYNEGIFGVAKLIFSAIYKENPHPQALFYRAICEIEVQNWQRAETLLSKLTSMDTYNMEYKWYYSLVALRNRKSEIAALHLIDIKYSRDDRAALAEEFLLELQNF